MWCDGGRDEKRGRSLCGGETRRRAGGQTGFKGGDEKRDEGQAKACDVAGNGRGILMIAGEGGDGAFSVCTGFSLFV